MTALTEITLAEARAGLAAKQFSASPLSAFAVQAMTTVCLAPVARSSERMARASS